MMLTRSAAAKLINHENPLNSRCNENGSANGDCIVAFTYRQLCCFLSILSKDESSKVQASISNAAYSKRLPSGKGRGRLAVLPVTDEASGIERTMSRGPGNARCMRPQSFKRRAKGRDHADYRRRTFRSFRIKDLLTGKFKINQLVRSKFGSFSYKLDKIKPENTSKTQTETIDPRLLEIGGTAQAEGMTAPHHFCTTEADSWDLEPLSLEDFEKNSLLEATLFDLEYIPLDSSFLENSSDNFDFNDLSQEMPSSSSVCSESSDTGPWQPPFTLRQLMNQERMGDYIMHLSPINENGDFQCPWTTCGKIGYNGRRHDLKRHYFTKHTKVKPFKCPMEGCTSELSRLYNLRDHLKRKHDVQEKAESVRLVALSKADARARAERANAQAFMAHANSQTVAQEILDNEAGPSHQGAVAVPGSGAMMQALTSAQLSTQDAESATAHFASALDDQLMFDPDNNSPLSEFEIYDWLNYPIDATDPESANNSGEELSYE